MTNSSFDLISNHGDYQLFHDLECGLAENNSQNRQRMRVAENKRERGASSRLLSFLSTRLLLLLLWHLILIQLHDDAVNKPNAAPKARKDNQSTTMNPISKYFHSFK